MKLIELHTGHIKPLIALLLRMHAESAFSKYPPALDRGEYILRSLLENPDVLTIGVVDDRSALVGALIVEVTDHPFIHYRMAKDVFFYTLRRGVSSGKAASMLLNALDVWLSDKPDVQFQMIEVSAGINNEAAAKFIRRMGYSDLGPVLVKETEAC